MNDDELITVVKESVTNVHMTIPAEQITSRSGEIRVRRRLSGLTGAAAVIAAAAIAVTTLPGHGNNSGAILTVKLLADRAANAALSQPAVRPGQWVYREIKWHTTPGGQWSSGTESTWTTAAGKRAYVGGAYFQVAIGALPYSELRFLPSNPAALERYLGNQPVPRALVGNCIRLPSRQVVKCPPPSLPRHLTRAEHAQIAFSQIQGMLWKYVLPPKLAAELFHALADVPGVTVLRDARDIAGQHGVAFVLPHVHQYGSRVDFLPGVKFPPERLELILNPHDYRLMAMSRTLMFTKASDYRAKVFDQEAIIRQAFVSGPAVRP